MRERLDLGGLAKFLNRERWSECFQETFEAHIGDLLDQAELDFDDLFDVIGEEASMTLWSCAFEDFLTEEFDVEGVNMVDDYLRRRGWKEGAHNRAYMKALRSSVMSLYEISDPVPGQSMRARDLIRGGEPVLVSASTTFQEGDRLAARIIPVAGKSVLCSGVLPFSAKASELLMDSLRSVFGEGNSGDLPVLADENMREIAPSFSVTWLLAALAEAMDENGPASLEVDDDVIETARLNSR